MKNIENIYRNTAPDYEAITKWSGYDRVPPRLMLAFKRATALTPGMRILDFGCGTGKVTQAVVDTNIPVEVTGLEPCFGMAKQYRERFTGNPRVKLQRGGYTDHLPLPDETFDVVLSSGVFDHIMITPNVLNEFMRVVKPEGFLAFTYRRHTALFSTDILKWGKTSYSHQDSYVRDCLIEANASVKRHDTMFGYLSVPLVRMGIFVAQKLL